MANAKTKPAGAGRPGGMTSLEIRAALILKGKLVSDIARFLGVHRTMVSQVVNRRTRTEYVRAAVASALGLTIEEVFGADGGDEKTTIAR